MLLRRTFFLSLLALAPVACGARSTLVDEAGAAIAGTGGAGTTTATTSSTSTTSTSTTSTSTTTTGTGGGATDCAKLAWVGPPVFLPAADVTGSPWLVRTSLDAYALAVDVEVPDATLLLSTAIEGWTTTWPPSPTPLAFTDALDWSDGRHAISAGGSGLFALAGAGSLSSMRLGLTAPGTTVNDVSQWSGTVGTAKALARSNGGAFLVAYGPDGGLVLDLVLDLAPSPKVVPLGMYGCTSLPLAVDAVGSGADGFLVASTNDSPFDDCIDPDLPGPPTVVQILRVTGSGVVSHGGFVEETGPVLALQISGRIGGAWLSYRVDGDPTLHIRAVNADGQLGKDLSVFGDALYGNAVIAYGDGLANATVFPGAPDSQAPPFVSLYVTTPAGVTGIPDFSAPDLHPVGRPALAASTDGRSFLVAFRNAPTQGLAEIGLLRADCAP